MVMGLCRASASLISVLITASCDTGGYCCWSTSQDNLKALVILELAEPPPIQIDPTAFAVMRLYVWLLIAP